ncbi:GDSL lipase/esterase [Dillenia turbinata]|uniref:GDSL lipase/esterase n=1 Tax=Dillenia turbinata TaxID=194707 RepID=A0AAN8VXJ9_9MAGN
MASVIVPPSAYLRNKIKRALYSVGLRKFFLAGVGPLGCIPNQRATGQAQPGRCVDYVNQILGTYNEGLRSLVNQLNSNHPGSIFVYGNTYGVVGDILNDPTKYGKTSLRNLSYFLFSAALFYPPKNFLLTGFSVIDRGCCGLGRNQGQITCLPFAVPCSNRNQYVFFDAYHTTQAANTILAQRAFSGPPLDCYPINVQQMALI